MFSGCSTMARSPFSKLSTNGWNGMARSNCRTSVRIASTRGMVVLLFRHHTCANQRLQALRFPVRCGTIRQARDPRQEATVMTRDLILGTAGHIDHGKTSLVKALTGIDCDRLPEEKARGITIDIGFATLDLGEFRLGIVDVPGHERFIKNMLAGATGIDLAVLVIAADDSVMPQTREHLEILQLLGLRHGLIALTKSDLVDATTRDVVGLEVRELVRGTFLADAPLVETSATSGVGIDELKS